MDDIRKLLGARCESENRPASSSSKMQAVSWTWSANHLSRVRHWRGRTRIKKFIRTNVSLRTNGWACCG